MTTEEFIKEFEERMKKQFKEYKDTKDYTYLPRLTGNLQDNAFQFKKDNRYKFCMKFYVDDKIAPYSKELNSRKWGKGWWDNHFYKDIVLNDVEIILTDILGKDNVSGGKDEDTV